LFQFTLAGGRIFSPSAGISPLCRGPETALPGFPRPEFPRRQPPQFLPFRNEGLPKFPREFFEMGDETQVFSPDHSPDVLFSPGRTWPQFLPPFYRPNIRSPAAQWPVGISPWPELGISAASLSKLQSKGRPRLGGTNRAPIWALGWAELKTPGIRRTPGAFGRKFYPGPAPVRAGIPQGQFAPDGGGPSGDRAGNWSVFASRNGPAMDPYLKANIALAPEITEGRFEAEALPRACWS